jgi:hypothetical protein
MEHTVKSEHRSSLEVLFKGVKLKVIDFTVATELILEGVVLRIKGGRVLAIEAGSVKGRASLAMENKTVLEKPFAPIPLPERLTWVQVCLCGRRTRSWFRRRWRSKSATLTCG